MDKRPSMRGREGSEGDPGGLPKRRKKSALERLVQEAEQMPPPKNDERTGRAKRHAKQKAALEEKRAGKRVAPAAKSDNEAGFSRKRAEASTASQNKNNPEKLKRRRSWDNILQEAHKINREIETQRLQNEPPERTCQEIHPKIQELNKELEDSYTSHPEQQHSPSLIEQGSRIMTSREKIPRAKRLGDLTKEITTSISEILSTLGHDTPQKGKKPALTSEQLDDIHCLVKFAVAQSEKATRKGRDDTRPTKEMDHELEQYRGLAAQIEKWAKFLNGKGDAPELTPPEVRRKYEIPSLEVTYEVAMPLLKDFKKYFPEAAKLVQGCIPAMQLVAEAAKDGVSFGGYAEEGPGKDNWPYTDITDATNKQVYIPKAQTDPIIATSDILFELANSIGRDSNTGGNKLSAEDYAYREMEKEVEPMFKTAEIWTQMKPQIEKTSNNLTDLDKYDGDFFVPDIKLYKDGKSSKDDIVREKLNAIYADGKYAGKYAGKTARQFYIEQYNREVASQSE